MSEQQSVTARMKFKRGELVEMTAEALQRDLQGPDRRWQGRVVGFGKDDHMVRVLRLGDKTPNAYHMNFWEHSEDETENI